MGNGIAERRVGSLRRELLDHVIVLSRSHLRRLLIEYVRYYHEDRTNLGLEKTLPAVEFQPQRCQDGSATYAWILAIRIARMIPNGSDTSKTTPCNAPRFSSEGPSHRLEFVVQF